MKNFDLELTMKLQQQLLLKNFKKFKKLIYGTQFSINLLKAETF